MSSFVAVLCVAPFVLPIGSGGQVPTKETPKQTPKSNAGAGGVTSSLKDATLLDIQARWRPFLDQLTSQARSLFGEPDRFYALADIADTYWPIDKVRSAELFLETLKEALSTKTGTTTNTSIAPSQPLTGIQETDEAGKAEMGKAIRVRNAMSYLIAVASKRDSSLSERLARLVAEERAKAADVSNNESASAALSLLRSGADPKRAAQIAEAGLPSRIVGDTLPVFIIELAQKNVSAADGLYEACLRRFGTNPQIPAGELLWLGGYPFGYGEAYGFSLNDRKNFAGLGGFRVSGLSANDRLANEYLDAMRALLQRTIANTASSSTVEQGRQNAKEDSNAIVLFATYYLLPEVERFNPESLGSWKALQQQALQGTSEPVQGEIRQRIESVYKSRPAADPREDSRSTSPQRVADAALERAEKLGDGCRRDVAYAEAAINIGFGKEFERAIATADKINELSLRASVKDYIFFEMSVANLDKSEPYASQKLADRIEAPEFKALLYLKIAATALKKGEKRYASELAIGVGELANKISEPKTQAGILLALAGLWARIEPRQAGYFLMDAIRATNRAQGQNVEKFSVMRKVELMCPGDTERWYGNASEAEGSSLYNTLATVAGTDLEGTIMIAGYIEDPVTRIRGMAFVARSVLKDGNTPARIDSTSSKTK